MKKPIHFKFLRSLFVLILLAGCCTLNSLGQNFRKLTIKEGLIDNNVLFLLQDDDGFIWAGTDNGISIYDGSEFINFGRNTFAHARVIGLTKTKDGTVMVLTADFKLHLFKQRKLWQSKQLPKGYYLSRLSSGRIFYDGYDSLYEIKGDLVKPLFACKKEILTIQEVDESYLVSYADDGMEVLNADFSIRFKMPVKSDFFVDTRGQVWLRSLLNELSPIDKESLLKNGMIRYKSLPNWTAHLNQTPVLDFLIDSDSITWVATRSKGLVKVSPSGKVEYFNKIIGFNNDVCHQVLEDKDKNIWAATNQGIAVITNKFVSYFSSVDGLSQSEAYCIFRDDENNRTLAGTVKGIDLISENKIINCPLPLQENLAVNDIIKFNGAYWIIRGSLLLKCNIDTEGHLTINKTFSMPVMPNYFLRFVPYTSEITFVTSTNGIAYLKGDELHWSNVGKLDVRTAFVVRDELWAGEVDTGLYLYKIRSEQRTVQLDLIRKIDALPDKNIRASLITKGGSVWLGGRYNGVMNFTPGDKVKNITTLDGLSGDVVRSLLEGTDHVWVGTNNGINKIQTIKDQISITTYDDVIQNEIFDIDKDGSGNIWLATNSGVIKFQDRSHTLTDRKLFFTDIRLGSSSPDVLSAAIPRLTYADNSASFHYTIPYFQNEQLTFSYRLLPTNEKWSEPQLTRSISFASLPAGSFQLEVRALIKNKNWTSDTLSYSFVVSPPIWQTRWFIWSVIFLFIVVIYGLIKWREKKLFVERQKKLEVQARVAAAELRALKAQINPHFIFNSLASIESIVLQNDFAAASDYIGKFSRLLRELLELSDQPLIPLERELNYTRLYLILESKRFPDKFKYTIQCPDELLAANFMVPPMMLQPIIENAINHGLFNSPRAGIVQVVFKMEHNKLIISIEDNGIGREAARAIKQQRSERTSYGLKLTRERLDLLKINSNIDARVEIIDLFSDTNESSGTKVNITLYYN